MLSGPSTPVVRGAGSIPELSIPFSSPSYHDQEGIMSTKTRVGQLGVGNSGTKRKNVTFLLAGNDKIEDLECVEKPPPEIDKNNELSDRNDDAREQASASSRSLPSAILISGDQKSTSSIGTRRTDIADSHNTATTSNCNSHNTMTTSSRPKTLSNSQNVTYNYVTHHHYPVHTGIMIFVLLGVTFLSLSIAQYNTLAVRSEESLTFLGGGC
ncbi:hypothetical protein L218DRAFT_500750 [Marasmius fiardii PR-910]|nr:hypothetical protein L218DRAFT_500750 [Marasmius fiardii PR-910]